MSLNTSFVICKMLLPIVIVLFSLFSPTLTLSWSMEHHYMEYNFINKLYFSKFTISNTKYNRTCRTFGAEFTSLKDAEHLKVYITAERLSDNNEWKVLPMLTWSLNVCFIVENNIFGIRDMIKNTNIVLKCPVKKGTYYIKDMRLDETKIVLPPGLIRLGKYRTFLSILDNTILAAKVSWYGAAVPIKKKY